MPTTPAEAPRTAPPPPLRWLIVPLVLSLLLLAIDRYTDADRTLSYLAFDPVSAGFPLRGNFWLDIVLNHWMKYAMITLACLVVGAVALSFTIPALKPRRRLLVFLALALTLAPLSVTAAKALSTRHCPWDIDEFGGLVPYTRLTDPAPANVEPGRCFPAGQASTGFAAMAFYFAAYARRKRKAAAAALVGGIAAGTVLGFGRVLQGAHFASHVAWSGLLCWSVMALLYWMLLGVHRGRGIREDEARA